MDGEDDQSIHFENGPAIALQSGSPAYINLNLVNPSISQSGYILNPVNTVSQNLVTYQPPVALQPYFAVQEADANLVNNLQVGVPVPIGLPVTAELLQNPNLVNTGIIIGNEDCNQSVIFKSTAENMPEPEDIKYSYMPKQIVQEIKPILTNDDTNIRLADMNGITMDNMMRKPCPLEMSIKAANIDLEVETCNPDELIQDTNGLIQSVSYPIIQKLPIQDQFPDTVILNVPVKLCDKPIIDVPIVQENIQRPKTQITWENNAMQGTAEYRESLICEVEEANDDENANVFEVNAAESSNVVLKLRRVADYVHDGRSREALESEFSSQEPVEMKAFKKVRHCCSKKECFKKIPIKEQIIAHKFFYEMDSIAKQNAYLANCLEHAQCNKLYENAKESNCVDDKNSGKPLMHDADIQMEIQNESNGDQTISNEIQNAINESLKECMANQAANLNEIADNDKTSDDEDADDTSGDEKDLNRHNWIYYFVTDHCRQTVCLQFLVKIFRITKRRIKMVQAKILSGKSICDYSLTRRTYNGSFDVWDFVRIHVNSLVSEENPLCRTHPRHRYVKDVKSMEDLFDRFREFYLKRVGFEASIKLNAYKRFVTKSAYVSINPNTPGSCIECDMIEDEEKDKNSSKSPAPQNNVEIEKDSQITRKERIKWDSSTDCDSSSDDEPLVKRENLKLKISLRNHKIQNTNYADNEKMKTRKSKRMASLARRRSTRGRDVWSLMLLHLETIPYKVCKSCISRKKHRFFYAPTTKQALYEDYRRYFLKETNSELGLGFSMYEKYFDRNCGFTIGDVDVNSPICPKCALEAPKPDLSKSNKKFAKQLTNSLRLSKQDEAS